MYLHLGQETVVRERDIIGIFDLDNTTVSRHTRKTLNEAEKAGVRCSAEDAIGPAAFSAVSLFIFACQGTVPFLPALNRAGPSPHG